MHNAQGHAGQVKSSQLFVWHQIITGVTQGHFSYSAGLDRTLYDIIYRGPTFPRVCIYFSNTQPHSTINTSIRGMQSAWCIIQWPPVGGFSQCCYHNVCAQTLLQLFIWIHNEKVPCSRTQTVHTHCPLYGRRKHRKILVYCSWN